MNNVPSPNINIDDPAAAIASFYNAIYAPQTNVVGAHPPAPYTAANYSAPFQFISPSSLTLNSISSAHSAASRSTLFSSGAQWLAANRDQLLAALENVSNTAGQPIPGSLSYGTFDLWFPSWAPIHNFVIDLAASIVKHDRDLLDWNHIWDADRMVAAAGAAMNLATRVVPWALDPEAHRHVGSLVPSIQDRLLELRAQLKLHAEEYASAFGLYIGDENKDSNLASFQQWREDSAYIHRWLNGVVFIPYLNGTVMKLIQKVHYGPDSIAKRMFDYYTYFPLLWQYASEYSWSATIPPNTWLEGNLAMRNVLGQFESGIRREHHWSPKIPLRIELFRGHFAVSKNRLFLDHGLKAEAKIFTEHWVTTTPPPAPPVFEVASDNEDEERI